MSTGQMPPMPPSTINDATPPTVVQPTPRETVVGGIRNLLANTSTAMGVPGQSYSQTPIAQAIARNQQQRLAQAQYHYGAAKTYAAALGMGAVDPQTGQPTGISPTNLDQNGQPAAMTPEERQHYQQLYQEAFGQYQKAAGVNKEAKDHIDKQGQLINVLVTKGHDAFRRLAEGIGLAKPQSAPGAMTPPPGAPEAPTGATASVDSGTGAGATPAAAASAPAGPPIPAAAPGATQGGMPPPPAAPAYDTMAQLQAPTLAQRVKANEDLEASAPAAARAAKYAIDLKKAGLHPTPKMYTDSSGAPFEGVSDSAGAIHRDTLDGEVVEGALATSAAQQTAKGKAEVVMSNGVPYGVKHNGKVVTPNDDEWSKGDQTMFDAAKSAHATGEQEKQTRADRAMSRYAQMRGQVQQYQVMDLDTGAPTFANANTINANPGKFSPLSPTQNLKDRVSVFKEIDQATQQVNDAINKLPDSGFDAEARAQFAIAMRNPDTNSAIHEFATSEAAKTLSPEQIDYVTALLSMRESAMALRSIGKMGGASDKLRGAIEAMVPGPSTPAKSYAKRQMTLFNNEVNQFRKALPSDKSLGMGEGGASTLPPPPSGGSTTTAPKTAADYLKSIGHPAAQ